MSCGTLPSFQQRRTISYRGIGWVPLRIFTSPEGIRGIPSLPKAFSRGQVVNSLAMLLLLLFLHHAHPWLADMQWRQGL